MNDQTESTSTEQQWAQTVARSAASLAYPPTPDLAARWQADSLRWESSSPHLRRVRLGWAIAMLLLALLVVSPPVRAGLLRLIQIGSVNIQLRDPDTIPAREVVQLPAATGMDEYLATFTDEVALASAAEQVGFLLRVPALLPLPHQVYEDRTNKVVTMVWKSTGDTEESVPAHGAILQQLGEGAVLWKMAPPTIEATLVHGTRALWTGGPYWVIQPDGVVIERHMVDTHALIWQEGNVTYRLESALSMQDAVRIAESLVPVSQSTGQEDTQ